MTANADAISHRDVLRWATEGSARCLGRDDIGRIEAGREADLALFTLDELRFSGAHDPIAALVHCGAHRADICSDVNCVCEQQQSDEAVQQPGRIMAAYIGSDAFARNAADTRARHLNTHHERESKECGPQHSIPESCARLRVGGDSARIIICGAGDESGPELLPERRF